VTPRNIPLNPLAIDYASVPGGAAIASDSALRRRFDSVLDFVVPKGTTRHLMLAASSVYTALPEKLRQLAGRILFSNVLQEKIRAKLELPPDPALFAIAERMPEAPKTILLTHDVDWSTCYSTLLKLAEAEARAGVRACYYFLLKSGAYIIKKQDLAELVAMGHEVGLHGLTYEIKLPYRSEARIVRDLSIAKSRLEDLLGRPIAGFRNHGLGLSNELMNALERLGFKYDSGIYPNYWHDPFRVNFFWPFAYAGRKLREIPTLFPLDTELFRSMRMSHAQALQIIVNRVKLAHSLKGVACIDMHPGILADHFDFYVEMVAALKELPGATFPTSCEVAARIPQSSAGRTTVAA
jgi:peptidoglycan/xylan/chitin deacetylase (PgdA/CDA1 family)